MPESHSATIALLFTDIEGSTGLWEQHPEAMRSALVHGALTERHEQQEARAVAVHQIFGR